MMKDWHSPNSAERKNIAEIYRYDFKLRCQRLGMGKLIFPK